MKKFFKNLAKVFGVLLFEVVYILGLGIYLIYYTEFFPTTRNMIVTTSMTTMRHQYFATWFLSQEKIDEILAANRTTSNVEEQDIDKVKVKETTNEKGTEGIEVINVSTDKFNAWLMVIDDPSRVDLVTAPYVGEVGSTTSQIVEHYGAVAGINAGGLANDTYGIGDLPTGLLITNSKHFNDVSYYEGFSMCGFTQDNRLYVSDSITRGTIDQLNLRCAVSFGPVLIVNGQPQISGAGLGWGLNPRTCIGQRQDGAVLFLVIDGRQIDSAGATIKQAQDILLSHGAYNAFNLDGGASTTMVFDSKLVNKPSDLAGERYVPTAFIVK